ncbi:MAG: ATP-binding protein [Armatimonadota bacterium]
MNLLRLQLSNFRQYIDIDITFDKGITAIIGANGSGKSTLLEAICWALYGAEALRTKIDEVRPLFISGLDASSSGGRGTNPKAILTFSLGENTYEVERTPLGARLYRLQSEREAIADGTTPVNQTVQRLLGGMTYRQFLTSFFAQQGELEFLNFDKARRRDEVLRMLGLERVTRSVKWMDEQLSLERSELRGKQSLPMSPEEAKAQLEQAREELARARVELGEAEQALQSARAEGERYERIYQQWNAKKTAHDSLQTQVQLLQQTIQVSEQEMNRLQGELREAKSARERLEELRPLGERYKQVREQLRQMGELQRYEQRRAELRVRIDSLKAQVADKERQLEEAEAELARLQAQKADLDKQENRVRDLKEKARQAEELRRQVEELENKRLEVQREISVLDAQIRSLEEQREQVNRQIALTEGIEEEIQRNEGLVREAEERVQSLEQELARLEQLRASAIASADAEAINLRQQIRDIEERRKRVEELGPDGRCPVCTRPLGEEFSGVVKHFEDELQDAERRLQSALSRKAEAERDTQHIGQCKERLREARADLQQYRDRFTRLQEQMRQREGWLQEAQSLQERLSSAKQQRDAIAGSYNAQEHESLRRQYEQMEPVIQQAVAEEQVWRERYSQWKREMERVNQTVEQLRAALEQARNEKVSAKQEMAQLPVGYDAELHDQLRQEMQRELQPAWDEALRLRPVADRLSDLQARFSEVEKKLHEAKEQLEQTNQRLRELAYDEQEYQSAVDQYTRYQETLKDAEAQVRVLKERVQQRKSQVATLEEQWERVQKHLRELRELERKIRRDTIVRDWLKSFGDMLNGEVVPELQERASELLNLLTDGRYTQTQISEDFEFTLIDEDRPKPIVSGGEEDIVNLSLRLAMAEMICERTGQPLGLLVLDEVFGSLDTDRRENTLQLLRRLRDRFDQIIIISHIEEIQAGADRCLRVDYDPSLHRSTVREYNMFVEADLLDEMTPEAEISAKPSETLGGLFAT